MRSARERSRRVEERDTLLGGWPSIGPGGRWFPTLVGLLLSGAALAAPTSASRPLQGIVLEVSAHEIIVDLGLEQGLPADAELRFYRRVSVKHPITGKQIEDRFPIGAVSAAEVGQLLSIVREMKPLSRTPRVGDFVVFEPPRRDALSPAPVAATPETPVAAQDAPGATALPADDAALQAVFAWTLGRPLPDRIRAYEGFLEVWPKSRDVEAVGKELAHLRQLVELERTGSQPTALLDAPGPLTARFSVPRAFVRGQPMPLVAAVLPRKEVEAVRAFVRVAGERLFETLPMTADGDFYFRARLDALVPPHAEGMQYYIEVVRADARLEPVAGTPDRPLLVVIEPAVLESADRSGRTSAQLTAEYVDFNASGDAADHYFQTEAEVTYRVDFKALQAVRVGAGLISGEGGATDAIDADPSLTRSVSLGYGFGEAELGLLDSLGIAARLSGGNHRANKNGASESVVGFEGRVRIGELDSTRLIVGAAVMEEVGSRAFTELDLEVFPRFPIVSTVTVTDLPVQADLGVRLTGQVGWRAKDWVTLLGIVGWNARTINHYGFTAGTGLAFSW